MKRNKLTAIIALVLIALMLVPAVASAATMKHAYTSGKIYLRSGPGTEYRSNGTVYNGDHIVVISYGDVWSRVRLDNGKTGYIKNLYINDGDMTYAAGTSYVNRYTAYITGNVNFRAGASTSTTSMGILERGTEVKVLGVNNGFYLICDPNNTQGFVSANYVSKTKPVDYSYDNSFSSSTSYTKTVIGHGVNLRAGGGYSYDILRTVPYGAKVSVIYEGTYWTRVSYNGTMGWLNNQYLR